MEFTYNNSYQPATGTLPFEALYGKSCKSPVCQGEVGERTLLGPEFVQATNVALQKIRARMQPSQSRQKSYVDVRRKDLEFEIDVKMFIKVAPMKGIMTFGRKGKLSMRKYVEDPTHVVDYEPLKLNDNSSYEEKPIEILAREVMFGQSSSSVRHDALKYVHNSRMKEGISVREHVLDMMVYFNITEVNGVVIDEKSQVSFIMESLSKSFLQFHTSAMMNKIEYNLTTLLNDLQTY
ncbi:uncharacterized protein LOC120090784 [Benincasa hispida]|uniref:uncharacterized protein LOC120090784 n=1 Tax=Benincasa hispida TaxID=102211 RepID=UPI001900FE61|nr:uncharacterized protein LOC120090784 [Benincasa hispida]